jgi:hypothetical protein
MVKRKAKKAAELVKLDLGCGASKRQGFIGVDRSRAEGVDVVCDLLANTSCGGKQRKMIRWPWEDSSVDEVHASHFFEHVRQDLRPLFMDELYRILKPQATAQFIVPHWLSSRAIQDFSHQWPSPGAPASWLYWNRGWREQNKLTHGDYEMKCNFGFSFSYSVNQAYQGRALEFLQANFETLPGVADDLIVILAKDPIQ